MGIDESITIYCDGACSGNPGPGGWGAVLIRSQQIHKIAGFEPDTTNNRMELMAAIKGLLAVREWMELELLSIDSSIDVYTDSQYLKHGITEWIITWKKNNWRKGTIKNQDLWQQLDQLTNDKVKWFWVRAHNGDHYNEMADQLARGAIKDNKR